MSSNKRVARGGLSARLATKESSTEPSAQSPPIEASGIAAAQAHPAAAPAAPKAVAKKAKKPAPAVEQADSRMAPTFQSAAAQQLAVMDDEEEDPVPEVLTRRSRKHGSIIDFDIPERLKKEGWDYEWKTTKVNLADVDISEMAGIHNQGWRPVRPEDMPELVPPGYRGRTIEMKGMILVTRPMHLTLDARREDYEIAETQKQDKLQAASAVPTSRPGLINPFVEKMEIVGEVGTHKQKGAAA